MPGCTVFRFCRAVPCCAVVYCIMMCCVVFYSDVLGCTVFCSAVLCRTVLCLVDCVVLFLADRFVQKLMFDRIVIVITFFQQIQQKH